MFMSSLTGKLCLVESMLNKQIILVLEKKNFIGNCFVDSQVIFGVSSGLYQHETAVIRFIL